MGLLPSNPMVHLRVIVRAFTSLISISGGSGGSAQSTGKPGLSSNMAQAEDAGGNAEYGSEKLCQPSMVADTFTGEHLFPNHILGRRNSTFPNCLVFTAGLYGRAGPKWDVD